MRFNEFLSNNQSLAEGVEDPAIFKAVFVIGGPGSGKTTVANKLGLPALGYVSMNTDIAFEYLMKKHNLDFKMPDSELAQREPVRKRAKEITAQKKSLAMEGRLGLLIDGTGDEFEKVSKVKAGLEELGYSTMLVVINTRLDIAKQRNLARDRTVPEDVLTRSWNAVQNNIGKFVQIFENVAIIDNNGNSSSPDPEQKRMSAETASQIQKTYQKLMKFTSMPPNKPLAQQWIASQRAPQSAARQN